MEYRIVDHSHYIIPGPPIPLKRARTSRGRWYDPQSAIKKQIQKDLLAQGTICLSGSLSVEMIFCMPVPQSWSKKKQAAAIGEPHTFRPDLDNLIKFILDMGNKILWDDDCLIYNLKAVKLWSNEPRTSILINV